MGAPGQPVPIPWYSQRSCTLGAEVSTVCTLAVHVPSSPPQQQHISLLIATGEADTIDGSPRTSCAWRFVDIEKARSLSCFFCLFMRATARRWSISLLASPFTTRNLPTTIKADQAQGSTRSAQGTGTGREGGFNRGTHVEKSRLSKASFRFVARRDFSSGEAKIGLNQSVISWSASGKCRECVRDPGDPGGARGS